MPGCLEEFDELAARLVAADTAGERGKVVAEAEKALAAAAGATDKTKAEIYVKIMRKMVKEGAEVPEAEMTRIKKVIEGGKVSEDKKKSMKQRLNVLRAFTQTQPTKDEL